MVNSSYVTLSRQSGLLAEMETVARNLANMSTTGYQREAGVFSEFIEETDGPAGSVSMTSNRTHYIDQTQGGHTFTGGALDFAIEGQGYFLIQNPAGEQRLTRAGAFQLGPEGQLMTVAGDTVLDAGGGQIVLPPNAGAIEVGRDGVISADGDLIGQLGLVTADPTTLTRAENTSYVAEQGFQPAFEAGIAQGYVESSNVNAVVELARMIEVQRTYEAGQTLLTTANDKTLNTIETLGRSV